MEEALERHSIEGVGRGVSHCLAPTSWRRRWRKGRAVAAQRRSEGEQSLR